MKRLIYKAVLFILVGVAILTAMHLAYIDNFEAKAEPVGFGQGCETIKTGFFWSQRRTVCDGPRRPDGSWTREREIWVPAGWTGGGCSFYTYSSYCSPRVWHDRGTVAYEQYVVFDSNVLPDEPGWLPPGTVIIR